MKKIIISLLILSLSVSILPLSLAFADDIKIIIDGQEQTYDVMPVIVNGRTLVPLRGIFETLGARVGWEDTTRTIIGSKGDKTIVLQPDNTLASVSGKEVTLDVPPQIISSRTMVPVRFISESLGAQVDWIGDTRTVTITSPKDTEQEINEEPTTEESSSSSENNPVIIDWAKFKESLKKYSNGFGSFNVKDDSVEIICETLPEKDSKFNFAIVTDFENIIKEGDVCLMSFKVKVNSGEGYVKPWVQDIKSRKALFAQTVVGSAGGDFTECYLPFVGIPDIRDIGIRFGGKIQNITLKDFKIENFGTTKNLSELPSTITGKNDTSPSFADLIANAQ